MIVHHYLINSNAGGEEGESARSPSTQSMLALAYSQETRYDRRSMWPPLSWLFLGVLLGLYASICGAGSMSEYLASDGQLQQTLVLEDVQGGVAGFTGTAWLIEPSGQWRVVPFHNIPLTSPRRQGKLAEAQLAALANQLATQDFLTLPRQLGGTPPVNPRQLTIRFGDKATTLVLSPLADLSEAAPPPKDPQAAEWARFVALVLVIEHWTMGEEADKQQDNPQHSPVP